MVEETAKVIRVLDKALVVETKRLSACQTCSSRDGCGQKKLTSLWGNRVSELLIDNPSGLEAQPGQQVVIGLNEQAILKASLLLYLLPLSLMIVTAMLSYSQGVSEGWMIIMSFAGLMIGFVIARWVSSVFFELADYQPVLLRLSL
ncbi:MULTISPECIES: SoxR reducing system RseC family protein [Nitrincola]|uniref:Sigma-E factor regulatory protein rseC n=1 Tax=Nitrincola nitratireducens TaxID=1229521 RepID=W9VM15_9GAMM|nr:MULTISPECIES: SoxR reducing system RseC family protein [Nitrincola]EXJ11565.1 Sigma-E factor regulatory protein rseC [Nitrincola nitratireducens]